MENEFGVSLFARRAGGMEPTPAALALLGPARAMYDAANAFELMAAGAAGAPGGTVRLTASIFMAHHVMPDIFARLRREAPEISLELVASDTTENLLFREADIAVRMVRPKQLDVVTRHFGEVQLGLYGNKSYLDRVGRPVTNEDLLRCDFVGYDRNEEIVRGFQAAGFDVDREFFTTRCDHQTTYWELVRAGCGLGFGQSRQARNDPNLEEITLEFPLPTLPVWLTAPAAIRHTPAVNRVWEILSEELPRVIDRPPGT